MLDTTQLTRKRSIVNRENLFAMVEHLKSVPDSYFTMAYYSDPIRKKQLDESTRVGGMPNPLLETPICNTIGCVLGHCISLDKDAMEQFRYNFSEISYSAWSVKFTGIQTNEPEWDWLFAQSWMNSDDTILGAMKRIIYFLSNGLPDDWEEQMQGIAPKVYQEIEIRDTAYYTRHENK